MNFQTPILIIAWRRPDTLRQVIDAIRPIAPTQVYVACDGPSLARAGEIEKVASTRQLIDQQVDWPCKIERYFSDVNQGCRLGVSRAITWFFNQVEEGIILEDDCVPHPDFFAYCTTLLERYRHDSRVWSICGSNFQSGLRRGEASYYFSIHGDSWGWATWRRAWDSYSIAEKKWFEFRDSRRFADVFPLRGERKYWLDILNGLFIDSSPNTWDYQWWLASWMGNGLHIWPTVNLISNIGFSEDATHTFCEFPFSNLPLCSLGPISHPDFILPSREADEHAFLFRRSGISFLMKDRSNAWANWVFLLFRFGAFKLLALLGSRLFGRLCRRPLLG